MQPWKISGIVKCPCLQKARSCCRHMVARFAGAIFLCAISMQKKPKSFWGINLDLSLLQIIAKIKPWKNWLFDVRGSFDLRVCFAWVLCWFLRISNLRDLAFSLGYFPLSNGITNQYAACTDRRS